VATQVALALTQGDATLAARDEGTTALTLWMSLTLAGLAVTGAAWAMRHVPLARGLGLAIGLAGLLMRVPFFDAGAMLEDDHFRYLLDGALVAHRIAPYAIAPAALARGAPGGPSAISASTGCSWRGSPGPVEIRPRPSRTSSPTRASPSRGKAFSWR